MRSSLFSAALLVPVLLACAGPVAGGAAGPAAPTIVRIDYSHVDGGSCMSGGGRPSLAWQETWNLSGCPTRATRGDAELTDACVAAINAECCAQVGATVVGWQGHVMGSEKLLSPLCRFQ